MRVEGILYLLAYGVFLTSAQTDLTRTRNANGSEVVRATIELISDSGVFRGCDDDNQLLRRIAYVETRDGTSRLPNGGIWRVTANMLNPTRTGRQLTSEYQLILSQFEIIWPTVSFSMLRIPLYSALAAGLFLCAVGEPIPIATDVMGQGMYWAQRYRGLTSDSAAVERFVRDVMELEMQESQCEIRGLDLIFLLDSSGSVGADNYELVKQFVADVSESLEIGPQRTQVGVISFSSTVHFDIDLDAHQTTPSLLQAIDALPYVSGGTDTAAGLNALVDEGFTQARGVRRIVEGFPRVTIVVTDGMSNNQELTVDAANRVKEANVQVFAVGVGNADDMELQAIATNSATDVFTLETFDVGELQRLQETLSETACRASTPVDVSQPLNTSVDRGNQVNVNYMCPEEGITFELCAGDRESELVMYISQNTTTTPSAALHDKELRASDGKCNDTFFNCQNFSNRRKSQEPASTGVTVYCTIRGIEERNTFTLDTTSGDTSTPRVNLQCTRMMQREILTVQCTSNQALLTVLCSFDTEPEIPCTLPLQVNLAEEGIGDHTLRIQVRDELNLTDSTTIQYSVEPLDLQCQGRLEEGEIFAVTCRANNLLESVLCSFDGGPLQPCTLPFEVDTNVLRIGTYDIQIVATDVFNLTDEATTQYIKPPFRVHFINSSPRVTGNMVMIDLQTSRPASSLQCYLRRPREPQSEAQDCSSGFITYTDLSPGIYFFRAVARTERNETTAQIRRSFTIANGSQCTVHLINDGITVNGRNATAQFISSAPVNTFTCTIDGGQPYLCRSPLRLNNLSPGEHKVRVIPQGCGNNFQGFTMRVPIAQEDD